MTDLKLCMVCICAFSFGILNHSLYSPVVYGFAGVPAHALNISITKTYLYNFDPLKPHFYIVKLGFTGVYIIFLFSAQNIDYGYSLEPPRWGGSNEYPQSMFWVEIWKISEFLSENFQVLVVKFLVYLNRHVFVMHMILFYCLYIMLNKHFASNF